MIVKSTFRQSNGIEAHLLRSDTNERVAVRHDLFRGPPDLHLCLRFMDGISRSNSKTKRSYVHIVVSPGRDLSDDGLKASLTMIESEFGIEPNSPRAIVQHVKGDRPDHYHAIYSIVGLETGRAISSHKNFETDELISRRLEIALNEPIVPGPRLAENVAELRRRDLNDEADILEPYTGTPMSGSLSRKDRQQATRIGIDPAAFSANVYALFEQADRDLASFRLLIRNAGYAVCKGQSAILIMDDATGFQTSLVRCLRREAKDAGRPAHLKEADLLKVFFDALPKAEERDAGFARSRAKAAQAFENELGCAMFEAVADGDVSELAKYRAVQKKRREAVAKQEQYLFQETLKSRRADILRLYQERDELRRARVDRAFRMARIVDSPILRRLAFALATMGVLMTGASLTMAVMGGGIAVLALPSVRRARTRAAASKLEGLRSTRSRTEALSEAYRRTKGEFAHAKQRVRFSFSDVPKFDRILVGFYATSWLSAGGSDEGLSATARKAGEVLGSDMIRGLKAMLDGGSALQIEQVMSWYTVLEDKKRNRAVNAALKRHHERAAPPVHGEPKAHTGGRHQSARTSTAVRKKSPPTPKPTRMNQGRIER